MELRFSSMGISIKENIGKENSMVRENIPGLMDRLFREIFMKE
jgi:hypothetical protein